MNRGSTVCPTGRGARTPTITQHSVGQCAKLSIHLSFTTFNNSLKPSPFRPHRNKNQKCFINGIQIVVLCFVCFPDLNIPCSGRCQALTSLSHWRTTIRYDTIYCNYLKTGVGMSNYFKSRKEMQNLTQRLI